VQWSFYNRTVKWLALLILAASQMRVHHSREPARSL
jgi:hypothetical protein